MRGHARVEEQLAELHAAGVQLAIDDFGTGWSSLHRLRDVPVSVLKVDRSFLAGVPRLAEPTAIVRAILELGAALGKTVVAEGVEDERQLAFLVGQACPLAQGFLLGRPVPASELDLPGSRPWRSPSTSADSSPSSSRTGATGEVLTLAYANEEAVARTRATGELHLWSRSRGELWHKGATQRQRPARSARCAWTATATRCWRSSSRRARPATPARARASSPATSSRRRRTRRCPAWSARSPSARASARRAPTPSSCSTTRPGSGARSGRRPRRSPAPRARRRDDRVDEEAADVLYHLTVLLHSRGRTLADAEEVLVGRRR